MRTPAAGDQTRAVWLVLASIASVQFGAAVAKQVFDVVPPVSMTWLRLAAAAGALALIRGVRVARRGRRTDDYRDTRQEPRDWRAVTGYALSLLGMNWAIYEAFHRLNLGIAVTIEFLGPLTLAVIGSRRRLDLAWAALALAGVALLGLAPTRLDPLGVVFALLAAACWAGYILTAARVGRSWDGLDALALACGLGAVLLAVPALLAGGPALWRGDVLLAGAGVGLLSSVIPYSLEIVALRVLSPGVFGILMSLEPAAAALAALLILRERLGPLDLLAMACVVVASVGATRRAPGTSSDTTNPDTPSADPDAPSAGTRHDAPTARVRIGARVRRSQP